MSEPGLIQQQRAILRTFRQATSQRAKAETDAETRGKAEREAADAALNQARQKAAAQLAQAQKAQEQAQAAMTQAGLQYLLEQTQPAKPAAHSSANPAQELARYVSVAVEAPASIQAGIEALQQWRIVAASRRRLRRLAFTAFVLVALLVLLVVGFRGYQTWRTEQLYRAAVTDLEAGQWEKARADLQKLASIDSNYKDSKILLCESYYRPAVAAVQAGQWDVAKEAITQLYRLDPTYKDIPSLITAHPELLILYQADWSSGPDGWPQSFGWRALNGMLVSDGAYGPGWGWRSNWIAAPCQLGQVPDYIVEAEIQLAQPTSCGCFGIVVREAYQVGVHVCGYQRVLIGTPDDEPFEGHDFSPGNSWHKYHVEVKGNTLTVIIDGQLIAEFKNIRHLSGGAAGLWSDRTRINVRSFTVSGAMTTR